MQFEELCSRGRTLVSAAGVTKGGGAEATGQSTPPLSSPLRGQPTPSPPLGPHTALRGGYHYHPVSHGTALPQRQEGPCRTSHSTRGRIPHPELSGERSAGASLRVERKGNPELGLGKEVRLPLLPWAFAWPRRGASLSPTCHLSHHLAAGGQQG